jgi:hypothetical protein
LHELIEPEVRSPVMNDDPSHTTVPPTFEENVDPATSRLEFTNASMPGPPFWVIAAPLDEERDVVNSGIGPCRYVLDTARNRAAIEKGISHDGLADRK